MSLYCRWILYQLSHQGGPRILDWVAYPFTRGSSRPKNPDPRIEPGFPALQVDFLPNIQKNKIIKHKCYQGCERHTENCQLFMKEIEDLNKWKDILCSWYGRLDNVKMTILYSDKSTDSM